MAHLTAATWVLLMVHEDETAQERREAGAHVRLVTGLAMAERAKPQSLKQYVHAWEEAATQQPKQPGEAIRKVDPSQQLLNDRYFGRMARAALVQPTALERAPQPEQTAQASASDQPIFVVERTRPRA